MMPMERDLPFKTDQAYHGFAEIQGLLHVERDHLLLEFEMKDSILGVLKSGAKELKISYLDLNQVEYQRSLFRSRLILKVNNMRVLSAFPGAKDGVIAMKIQRKYKTEVEDIVPYVNMRIADLKLEQLEG